MRLTCPNCNAQYEVPDDVIPETGRDVQCSNCEQTWFQPKHPDKDGQANVAENEPAPTAAETPPEDPAEPSAPKPEDSARPAPGSEAPKPEPRSSVDPSVASILQEEAAREAELRAKEGTSLESQPDLGLDTPPKPAPDTKPPAATEIAGGDAQTDSLPDVDSINSSLRGDAAANPAAEPAASPRRSGGFMRGFALMLIIGVVLFLIYGNARQISEAVPQAEPALQSYVTLVDKARIWLETQAGSAAE
ncbi:MJ0042 family finger-like domain-containing protein [Ruegeria intermedia]|uniref:MJ0042 family finger-like domain-containing protein n=1 Tax=Ruegeria intermedia TaxID=996115 RepID=A0A1M5AET2_9RHOB|nr:zinc-ribbon domain-containing protein [Ruegeria intermedia]SHF28655.1 MJ0042 family finger-like domain-containing protein [Ruegeria intermedia]